MSAEVKVIESPTVADVMIMNSSDDDSRAFADIYDRDENLVGSLIELAGGITGVNMARNGMRRIELVTYEDGTKIARIIRDDDDGDSMSPFFCSPTPNLSKALKTAV